ncbi:MAG: diguanylate cyclase [Desulfobacteraceae bacterium]|nr:diguanylate cyclase [Desulfobacteraceae bacterium]
MPDQLNILIVDDRPENLLTLELLLEKPELNIVKAESGNQALGMLLQYDFALVLLDVQMPEMDGFETAELMRSSRKTKHIPIIFVTASHTEKHNIFKGYDSGAVDYLFKPLEAAVLKSKVEVFLELQRQRNQLQAKTRELDAKILELKEAQIQLKERNEQLKLLSSLDGLTHIHNRRRFDEVLQSEWKRAMRNGKNLCLIMLDVDYFKAYNDNYGHPAGDFCLQRIAKALASVFKRPMDIVARYGGEEFCAILPGTDERGGAKVAENLRSTVEQLEIEHAKSAEYGRITVSLGVCAIVPCLKTYSTDLVKAADKALYRAKRLGRNRCEVGRVSKSSQPASKPPPELGSGLAY